MKADKPDRRIEKSRHSIYKALTDLMQEKKYCNISIQEIVDKANVGRSTFYAHFDTKDELLSSCIENVFELLNKHITDCVEQADNQTRYIPVAELFEHLMDNSQLVRGVMSAESADLLFDKIQSYWNIKIENYLNTLLSDGKEPKIPLEILTNHITNTIIELLKWWMSHTITYTPQQMEQYFHELINPCIQSVISRDAFIE